MTRVVFISDTHGHRVEIPPCDVLVHCGDATGIGGVDQLESFNSWMRNLKKTGVVKEIVFVAGNHELLLDETHRASRTRKTTLHQRAVSALSDVTYLRDSGVTLCGVKFYGSPWTPRFYDWAFQIDNEDHGKRIFSSVPEGTDVIVTHGPPLGVLDLCDDGRVVGSRALLETVLRVKPKVHSFGHIHHSYGQVHDVETNIRFVNASTCTEAYRPLNLPISIDLEKI